MRSIINILINLIWLIVSVNVVIAQEGSPHLTAPVEKKLIYHNVHQYYIMQYSPPIEVKVGEYTVEKIKSVPEPDERTAMAFLSSKAQGNVEWYYSLLDDALKQQFDAALKSSKKTRDDIGQDWKKKYLNLRFELTTRVEREFCVIIRYRAISIPDNVVKEENDVAICKNRGWVISDLKGDIIYENWDIKGTEKIIRTTNKKTDR